MTMVTHKYYGIYVTYPLWASWRHGPLARSGGTKKALHLGTEIGRLVECSWLGSLNRPIPRV
jgi:hypothetical protein